LCLRTIRKVQDEEVQRIIKEETEHRILAAYIHGLRGVVGQQVQFQMPSTMEQAVRLALTVENAEKHKQMVGGSRKEGIPFREINDDQGRRERIWAPEKKIFGPRARVDQLKVLTLN
jgi:hypothetical protein